MKEVGNLVFKTKKTSKWIKNGRRNRFGKCSGRPPFNRERSSARIFASSCYTPTQTAAKHSCYHCIQPKNAISRTGAISFEILVGDNKFIDVGSTMFYVKCSVRTAQSEVIPSKIAHPTDPTQPDIVNPKVKTVSVNGIGHTIFNNVKVSLNGT